jgi:hypothetical protein
MFGAAGDIFGQTPNLDAFDQEQPTPAAPGQGGPLLTDGQDPYSLGPQPAVPQYPPGTAVIAVDGRQPTAPATATAGEWAALEPVDASPEAGLRSAGFTALFATAAVGTGIAVGGGVGGAAGLLLAGALTNAYRAQKWWGSTQPSQKHEAMVSGVFAVAGLGIGGWLAWKAAQLRQESEE